MGFLSNIFRKKEQKTAPQTENIGVGDSTSTSPGSLSMEVISLIADSPCCWPSDLSAEKLSTVDIPLVVGKLKAYETMAHPRDLTTASMGAPLIYPQYDSAGRRQGIPVEDQKICSVASCGFLKGRQHALDQRTVDIATEVIMHYAKTPLAKAVLQIPMVHSIVVARQNGKESERPSDRDHAVSLLKMMENIYFELYEELEEGVVTDDMVRDKFLQILFGGTENFSHHLFTGVLDRLPEQV